MSEKKSLTLSFLFYFVIWQVAAMALDSSVLLASPAEVAFRLFDLIRTSSFWASIAFSLSRIFLGLLISIILSFVTAPLCAKYKILKILHEPLVMLMKATPVASITILILIWVSSRNLSVVISFMMVYPVIFTSIHDGIVHFDRKLIEMSRIYSVKRMKKIRYLYVPSLTNAFESAFTVSLSLCFKSGIAAEVIAIPDGSIGEKLYEAKLYLATGDLFAWTLMIIVLAKAFEKIFLAIERKVVRRIEA